MTRRPHAPPEPLGPGSILLALLVSAFWGGNIVALKLGLTVFPPFWSAFWRMALGVLVVAGWARVQGVPLWPAPGERRALLLLGLIFAPQIALLNVGTNFTSPAYSTVFMNSHPIFANLLGHFVASERRLTPARVAGLALAFCGICYLILGQPMAALASNPLLGNLLVTSSAFLLAIRNIYTRRLVQNIEPARAMTWQFLVSLPFFLAPALILEPMLSRPVTTKPLIALLYQSVVVAGFCFIVWTNLLRRHASATLSMISFTVPFFGILLSALLFGEPVTARVLVATALLTVGIAIGGRR